MVFTVIKEPVRYRIGDTQAEFVARNPEWSKWIEPHADGLMIPVFDGRPNAIIHFENGKLVEIEEIAAHLPTQRVRE
jgi:hypothetical protein